MPGVPIRVDGVSKRFDKTIALDDVSLSKSIRARSSDCSVPTAPARPR
jgi:hypothetical protein